LPFYWKSGDAFTHFGVACVSLENFTSITPNANTCFFSFFRVGSTLVTMLFFKDHFMSHFSSSHDFCVTQTMMEAPTLVSSLTSATLNPKPQK
jgi:hypothetical protein